MSMELNLDEKNISEIYKLGKSLKNSKYGFKTAEEKAMKLFTLMFKWSILNGNREIMKNFPWTLITIRDFANHIRPLNSVFLYSEYESGENLDSNKTFKIIPDETNGVENKKFCEIYSSNSSINFRKECLKKKTNVDKIVEKTNEENDDISNVTKKQQLGSINETLKSSNYYKESKNESITRNYFSVKIKKGLKRYNCKSCAKIFTTKFDVSNHVRKDHRREVRFECGICHEQFSNFSSLYFHKNIHKNSRKYSCKHCGKFCMKSNAFNWQANRVHNNMKRNQIRSTNEAISERAKQATINSDIEKLQDDCVTRPTRRQRGPNIDYSEIDLHIKRTKTNSVERFKCNLCNKVLQSKYAARLHIRQVHLNEETYACKLCEQKYRKYVALKQHIESVHKNYQDVTKLKIEHFKRLTCPGGSKLIDNSEVGRDEKFECNWCNKLFASKQSVRLHVSMIHLKEETFSCKLCDQKFMNHYNLKKHVKSTHKQE
ncbi:zinc finger protein OZF-like protein, partial [Leptotrombidium deliense]